MNYYRFFKKGFAPIELLVVLSIITVVSSVIFTSTQSAQKKARDTRRIADLAQVRNALELYFSENGKYPLSPADLQSDKDIVGVNSTRVGSTESSWDELQSTLSSPRKYIGELPHDPLESASPSACSGYGVICYAATQGKYTGYSYAYIVNNDGSKYELMAQLEQPNIQDCEHAPGQYINRIPDLYFFADPGHNYCTNIGSVGTTSPSNLHYSPQLLVVH